MDAFWNFLNSCFQKLFNLMNHLQMTPNRIFLVIGFIGAIGWIIYQYQHRHEEKGKVPHKEN